MSNVQEEKKALFKKAVERASLAPSIHNTQPWHFVVRPDALELHADNDRAESTGPHGPPTRHQLRLCTVNARVGLAADRMVDMDRFPAPRNLTCLHDSPCSMSPLHGRRWSG